MITTTEREREGEAKNVRGNKSEKVSLSLLRVCLWLVSVSVNQNFARSTQENYSVLEEKRNEATARQS